MFSPRRRRATISAIVVLIVWAIATVFVPAAALLEIVSTLLLLACFLGLWRWGPTGWRVFWGGASRPEDWGILAVDFMLLSIAALRVYAMIFRYMGRPEWLQNSHWSGFFVYLMLCAVTLFVAATKDERSK